MSTYTVSVSNTFDAESHEDAVMQMVAWLLDNAGQAGYRSLKHDHLDPEGNHEIFIDAEKIGPPRGLSGNYFPVAT